MSNVINLDDHRHTPISRRKQRRLYLDQVIEGIVYEMETNPTLSDEDYKNLEFVYLFLCGLEKRVQAGVKICPDLNF